MVEHKPLTDLVSFALSTLPVLAIVALMAASFVELKRTRRNARRLIVSARIDDARQFQ
jgi:hypothetical protein